LLEASLWCVARISNFVDDVILAANQGEDADTTAAITGHLAGVLYRAGGIPKEWLAKLAWRERIEAMAGTLFDPAWGSTSI
jgi:ADP-ribosyl-[dinitrogen reductase] hydrolase